MKNNTALVVLSLLNAVFFGLHLTGDIVFGIEKGGRAILVGVLIFVLYLYGAAGLPEWLAGYVIMLLGGLASAAVPYVHTARPLGERFGQLPGGFFSSGRCSRWVGRGSWHSPCPCRPFGVGCRSADDARTPPGPTTPAFWAGTRPEHVLFFCCRTAKRDLRCARSAFTM